FVPLVQKRGAAVIEARGASSAFSAAQALIDHVRSLTAATAGDDWFSAAVLSDGKRYGVPAGVVASFPLRSMGLGEWRIQDGAVITEYAKRKIEASVQELVQEREIVSELLRCSRKTRAAPPPPIVRRPGLARPQRVAPAAASGGAP